MIKMQDIGELGYGGLVTLAEWYDDKRIEEGKITKKDILKKISTYAYVLPGGLCTLTSAFGWVRALKPWDEHISHGFIYDFPRFLKNIVGAMREPAGKGSSSAAVREAERLLELQRRRSTSKQLNEGRHTSAWAYTPEEVRGVVGQGHTVRDYA